MGLPWPRRRLMTTTSRPLRPQRSAASVELVAEGDGRGATEEARMQNFAGTTAGDGTDLNSPFAEALAKRLPERGLAIQLPGGSVRDDVLAATRPK